MPYSSSAYARLLFQLLFQERSGIALRFLLYHLFRGAGKQDLAAFTTAFGTHVDQVVGAFDDVEVMLDDDDGVALFHQLVQDTQKNTDVFEMKTGCRPVNIMYCLYPF